MPCWGRGMDSAMEKFISFIPVHFSVLFPGASLMLGIRCPVRFCPISGLPRASYIFLHWHAEVRFLTG